MTADITYFQITDAIHNGTYRVFMKCVDGPHTLSAANGCLNNMSGNITCADDSIWILQITADSIFCYMTVTNFIDHNSP